VERSLTVKYRIDEKDPKQVLLGNLLDRAIETATLKVWKKVINKDVVEELRLCNVVLADPAIFVGNDGTTIRVVTKEADGRDTSIEAEDEDDEGDADDEEDDKRANPPRVRPSR
jgi:hypothetical protein